MRVVFDGLTTILQDSGNLPTCYLAALRSLGLDLREAKRMARDLTLLESLRRSSGCVNRAELLREYLSERGVRPTLDDIQRAANAFNEVWISTVTPVPGSKSLLESLKGMGASIGVLFIGVESGESAPTEVLKSASLSGLVDVSLYSGSEGWLESLRRLLSALQGDPPDVFVTGVVERALASSQLGLRPIFLGRRESVKRVSRASGFGELLRVLRELSRGTVTGGRRSS